MKKKAGIVVAASAASLLALSPLAFAGDTGWVGGENTDHSAVDKHAEDYFADDHGNNVSVPLTVCNNDVVGSGAGGAAKDVKGALSGAGTLFGSSEAESQVHSQDNRSCETESAAGDN